MNTRAVSQSHIPALDGLRGLAILAVMVTHFACSVPVPHCTFARGLRAIATGGWMGVDLFFVLSGYLITGILLRAKKGPGYFRNFYARRFLRIFPLYYGALFVLFVVLPRLTHLDAESLRVERLQGWLWAYAANLETALSGRFDFDVGIYQLSHLWSLSVEEHFYLVWPLVVWWLSERRLLRVAIGVCLVAPALRGILVGAHVFAGTIYMSTPCRVDAMAMGALVALLMRQPPGRDVALRLARWALPVSIAFFAALFAVRHGDLDEWSAPMSTVGYSLADAGSASLLVFALARQRALVVALESRALSALGKYSYGAYVLHWPLQAAFQWLLFDRLIKWGEVPALVLYTVGSIALTAALACAVWHVYERPFLRLKTYFDYRPHPAIAMALEPSKRSAVS